MPYVYLDMLKQAEPETGKSTHVHNKTVEFHFVVFGLYDYMFWGGIHDSIAKMKQQHEARHKLCWKYERQPIFLYCPEAQAEITNQLFSNTENRNYPLVLSLIQLDKTKFGNFAVELDAYLERFQKKVNEKLGNSSMASVYWNLGGSDIAIVFRADTLESVAKVLHMLQTEHIEGVSPIFSISSHCAIVSGTQNKTVNVEELDAWIDRDQSVIFHLLFETSHGHNGLLSGQRDTRLVLGERDYEMLLPPNRAEWAEVLTTYLGAAPKDKGIYHHRTTYIVPEIAMSMSAAQLNPGSSFAWGEAADKVFDTLHDICKIVGQADFAYGKTCSKNQEQISHCYNSLLGLYKHAFRLQATMGQYDLFCYVNRIYAALQVILYSYKKELERIENSPVAERDVYHFRELLSELTKQIFIVVAELQHLFSILSISPHTYMETHGSSMRSLNAATKLWDAYNGIVCALKGIFPSVLSSVQIDNTIMLSPYREKQSENIQLFPLADNTNPIVLVQMNFSLMFDTKLALYMLIHECGHHFANRCRFERFTYMSKAMLQYILGDVCDYFVLSPLYMLVTIMEKKPRIRLKEYRMLQKKEKKTADDYKKLLLLNIEAASEDEYERLYSEYGQLLHDVLLKEIKSGIDLLFERIERIYKEHYKNRTNQAWRSDDYFGREVQKVYNMLSDELIGSLVFNVNQRIRQKVQEFIVLLNSETKLDQYQFSKLQAFWAFEPTEDVLEEKSRALIDSQNKAKLSKEVLEIFRETFADMFAVQVLDLRLNEYLNLFNDFSDVYPSLITNRTNLLRVYIVSSTRYGDDRCLLNWLDSEQCSYSENDKSKAKGILLDLMQNPICEYVKGYAVKSMEELQKEIGSSGNNTAILKRLRILFTKNSDSNEVASTLWYFWKYNMNCL